MNAPSTTEQLAPDALHKPFTWLHASLSGNADAEFAALTKTICTGVTTCIQLIQQNAIAHDNGDAPLLDANDSHALMMLAAASTQMLADAAEERIDFLWDRANPLPATSGSKK